MKKRIGLILLSALVVTIFGIVVIGFAAYCLDLRRLGKDDLIPIEEITGINSKATLKPGCKVMNSYHFPYDDYKDDYKPVCHCRELKNDLNWDVIDPYIGFTVKDSPEIAASNIRIVDVYGDKCTITFNIADNNSTYGCDDYPLENLDYNVKEVEAADDGIKTDLDGSRYTLDRRYLKKSQRIIIAVVICGTVVMGIVFLLIWRKNKHRGDCFDK